MRRVLYPLSVARLGVLPLLRFVALLIGSYVLRFADRKSVSRWHGVPVSSDSATDARSSQYSASLRPHPRTSHKHFGETPIVIHTRKPTQ